MAGRFCWLGVLAALLVPSGVQAQGILFPGSGGMHRSMGGASTAAGVDALGALYWNPAAISGLTRSEVVIGGELLYGDTYVSSTAPVRPFRSGEFVTGTTRSDSGVSLLSGLGLVIKPDEPGVTAGLAIATIAGGGVNYAGTTTNPVFNPTGPLDRLILGPQAASMVIFSIMPTAAFQVSDKLSIGVGVMVDTALVSFDPALFATPEDSNGDGLFSFPSGTHSRPFWGGGFRAGATYQVFDQFTVGFSYTSPHWFEKWYFNSRNEIGEPLQVSTTLTLPQILSAGLAFQPTSQLLVTADLRWFDYSTSKLLGEAPQNGGAGWDSIWAVALGGRYQVTDNLSLQLGYLYNQNPIPSNLALINILQPMVVQHTVSCGAYYQMNENLGMSLAYIHGFMGSVEGSLVQAANTSTKIESEYDSLAFGIHIKFGGPGKREAPVSTACPTPTCPQ